MFALTTEQAARDFLGDDLYSNLREHFEKELMVSGIHGKMTLADLLKARECTPEKRFGVFNHFKFNNLIPKAIGHKLLTLLARDGYIPNQFFPVVDANCNNEWLEILEVFGLAANDKSGMTLGELKASTAALSSLRFESKKGEREAFLKTFAKYKQTFPQIAKIKKHVMQMYMQIFSDVPALDLVKICPELSSIMGVGANGLLDFSLWANPSEDYYRNCAKAFLDIKNPNGKDRKWLLLNLYKVMDENLAILTVIPAQAAYLAGYPVEDIAEGLLKRIEPLARHTLGQYPECDRYIEFALKRPFMGFPEAWGALGISEGDFLGIMHVEPELSEIFERTAFRNGMGTAIASLNSYFSMDDVLHGITREGAWFHNPELRHHLGYMAGGTVNLGLLTDDECKEMLIAATRSERGALNLMKTFRWQESSQTDMARIQNMLKILSQKCGNEALADYLYMVLEQRGSTIRSIDGRYLCEKAEFAKSLARLNPEVCMSLKEKILDQKKPKSSMVDLVIDLGEISPEQMQKLSHKHRDRVFSIDLGL